MRIIECRQQTEEWESLRNRPTCSEFFRFCSPVEGKYAAGSTKYAAKIVAKRLGVYTEPPPSWDMDWGIEHEPNARHWYSNTFGPVRQAGFVLPDDTDTFGGSPDGLVGDSGIIEIKCPRSDILIMYHAEGVVPACYRPQIQGLLLVTGREWCDFVAWHPELTPFVFRVAADPGYQAKILDCLSKLLKEIEHIESLVRKERHKLISVGTSKSEVRFTDE